MARSGIECTAECSDLFNEVVRGTKGYAVFAVNSSSDAIVPQASGPTVDVSESRERWESFIRSLPDEEARYVMYDFVAMHPTENRRISKIVFVSWATDNMPVKMKMVHASSKDAVTRGLNFSGPEVQASDLGDLDYDAVLNMIA